MEKICNVCSLKKNITLFSKDKRVKSGYSSRCIDCLSIYNKQYKIKNKDALNKKRKTYYFENRDKILQKEKNRAKHSKEKISAYRKKYYKENKHKFIKKKSSVIKNKYIKKEKTIDELNKIKQLYASKKAIYIEKNKDKIKAKKRIYSQLNKEKLNKYRREYRKRKRAENITYRLSEVMSCVVRDCLRGTKNNTTWKSMVDYSIEDLKIHIESKFTKNMSWTNYGKNGWHIDHIIPQYYFKYTSYKDKAFQACWALSNLQPLWATTEIAISNGEDVDYIGNIEKSNNIIMTKEIQDFLNVVNC